MRLPFALPSKLHAFSAEFMSAFDAESDHLPPVSSRVDANACSDAQFTVVHDFLPSAQPKTIAATASETVSFITSSIRALVPTASGSTQQQPSASTMRTDTAPSDPSLCCPDAQEAVSRELAAFNRLTASSPLSAFVDTLRRNYMRISFAMLLFGLLLLYLL